MDSAKNCAVASSQKLCERSQMPRSPMTGRRRRHARGIADVSGQRALRGLGLGLERGAQVRVMQADGAVQFIVVALEESIFVRDLDYGEAELGVDLRAYGVDVAPPFDIPVPRLAVVIAHVECNGLDLVPPAVAEAPEAVQAYALGIAAAQGLVEINLVAVARITLELDGRLGREDERAECHLERIGEQVRRFIGERRWRTQHEHGHAHPCRPAARRTGARSR